MKRGNHSNQGDKPRKASRGSSKVVFLKGTVLISGVLVFWFFLTQSDARRSLPKGMSEIKEFQSSHGWDGHYGLTAKGTITHDEFWEYAYELGFTSRNRVDRLTDSMLSWQDYPEPGWNPPTHPEILLYQESDIDSVQILALNRNRIWYTDIFW